METITLVFSVSEFIQDEQKLILGHYFHKATQEAKRFGYAHLGKSFFIQGLPLLGIGNEKIYWTRDRKPGYETLAVDWRVEMPPSIVRGMRGEFITAEGDLTPMGQILTEPEKKNGVPLCNGQYQLHLEVDEYPEIEKDDGMIRLRHGMVTNFKFVHRDEAEYFRYGNKVNISSFFETAFFGTPKGEQKVYETPEEVKDLLDRMMAQNPSRKARAAKARVSDATPAATPVDPPAQNDWMKLVGGLEDAPPEGDEPESESESNEEFDLDEL